MGNCTMLAFSVLFELMEMSMTPLNQLFLTLDPSILFRIISETARSISETCYSLKTKYTSNMFFEKDAFRKALDVRLLKSWKLRFSMQPARPPTDPHPQPLPPPFRGLKLTPSPSLNTSLPPPIQREFVKPLSLEGPQLHPYRFCTSRFNFVFVFTKVEHFKF